MRKITLYVGLFDKDTHTQLINTLSAYQVVSNIVPDCTITEGKGKYTHIDGSVVIEPTLIVEILHFGENFDKEYYTKLANKIKVALNQESVAYQEQEIESELI